MRRRFSVVVFFAAALWIPGTVAAQDVLQAPLGAQTWVDFTSGSGVGALWGGVQVGKYNGILTSEPGSPGVTLYCVDFAHYAGDGAGTQRNVSNLGAGGNVGATRLGLQGVGDSMLRYRKAAFLSSMFDAWTEGDLGGSTGIDFASVTANQTHAWSGIHAAIWTIMAGPTFTFPDGVGWVSNQAQAEQYADPWLEWIDAMESNDPTFGGMDFSEWSVLTDVAATGQGPQGNPGGKQEYLVRVTTPEPGTMALILTGLTLFAFTARRRRLADLEHLAG